MGTESGGSIIRERWPSYRRLVLSASSAFSFVAITESEGRNDHVAFSIRSCCKKAVIIMFTVDTGGKRVVIAHTVRTSDGPVHLTTTFDLNDVPDDKLLLWAATNRLTRWLHSAEFGQLTSNEVKKRFDNHVIECKQYFQTNDQAISREEKIILSNLRDVTKKGASMETVLQALMRSTLQFGH
jgi:hypothetical protein